ncbi:hypothetical protein TNCV_4789241 [Trichonephila clavipes]|nr:hypothetical protein TNCV_4789241 [Trichonephila clavipes]
MITKGIRATIKRFKETGKLGTQSARGHQRVTTVLVDGVKTAVNAQSQTSEFGVVACEQFLERQAILTTPSEKYSENIMHYFPYMICQTQELFDRDKTQRISFENENERSLQGKLTDDTAGVTKLEPALTLIPVLMRGKCI